MSAARASAAAPSVVGVIGAGAMGMGVVASLLRGGIATAVCDVSDTARRDARDRGAALASSAAALAQRCGITIVLVVDTDQVDEALFGPDGFATTPSVDRVLVMSSTLPPDYVAALAPRLARAGSTLVDAPVSGGPARAHAGTMTIMAAGPAAALERCEPVFARIAGKVFRVGSAAGDGAKFKIVNNLLAAVNLAAAAEALALARRAGLDPAQVAEVVGASSGASWIFGDRVPRALAGDFAPRAAAKILAKDAAIAAAFAARLGADATFARAAKAAFEAAVRAGYGDADDASIIEWAASRSGANATT
ncbi:MAG: NAD(P)-dependent oxidoreductase [Casimicrobiaceae bacterium]